MPKSDAVSASLINQWAASGVMAERRGLRLPKVTDAEVKSTKNKRIRQRLEAAVFQARANKRKN